MKVYRLKTDVERYQYFLADPREDENLLVMDCKPKSQEWKPPGVFIYEPKHEPGDFYNFGSSLLITNPRATELLRIHLETAGELLPLPYEDSIYYALNVTLCINCLNHERTEWILGKSTGKKIGISRYSFWYDRFSESDLFKIPETCKSEILYVEGLKDPEDSFRFVVESNGLKGLLFEEIWVGT